MSSPISAEEADPAINRSRISGLRDDAGRISTFAVARCAITLNTGITAGATPDTPVVMSFAERIPFGRVAEAAEIAGVVAFLASFDARYMTGAQVPVDGGLSVAGFGERA
ncbi:SDR family oxidoreductase [Streptomyces sp. NPDC002870]|uniref:SDR family oxidoreductase n=1 Tax=Streptomyces sp. NPDC002870 TaxID=3364666 RepID=UPI00367727FD